MTSGLRNHHVVGGHGRFRSTPPRSGNRLGETKKPINHNQQSDQRSVSGPLGRYLLVHCSPDGMSLNELGRLIPVWIRKRFGPEIISKCAERPPIVAGVDLAALWSRVSLLYSTLSRVPITSRYGMRRGRMHWGIDLAAPAGTPMQRSASGRVTFAGWQRGYGLIVILDHGPYQTKYAHNDGDLVRRRG